jgi:hypothetical protein
MPIRKPAQHNTEHPPGCITQEQMLANKQADAYYAAKKKKLTFEEWWMSVPMNVLEDANDGGPYDVALLAWQAAQENKL